MRRSQHSFSRPWRPAIFTAACLLLPTAAVPLPAGRSQTDLDRERFLRDARIVRTETIPVGVTAPLRATLSLEGETHDAQIQRVNANMKRFRTPKNTYSNILDSYRFNIAAYRLDRLLGLKMVPVSVERKYKGRKAAVTWWVDDVMMTDAQRYEKKIPPPHPVSWNDQRHQARIFHQLIRNLDPNLGNFLILKDWRLRLIDFTRAFQRQPELLEPRLVQRVDRRVYDGLRALTLERLEREAVPALTRHEAKAVMARRDAILELLAA
ncbi:MAG: hypothetical protein ACE5EG_10375 [Thermoanaerobaculia bacterium]